MIRLTGVLTDASGNTTLPHAIIEFISKSNSGDALIHSTVYHRTDHLARYDFTLKSGEYDVFAQVSRRSDVDHVGDCSVSPAMSGDYTLESLLIFDEPVPHPSVVTVMNIRDQLLDSQQELEDDQTALNDRMTAFNQSYQTAQSHFSSVQTMHANVVDKHGVIVDYHATILDAVATTAGNKSAAESASQDAILARNKAWMFASNPENSPIDGSFYSAKHWALKALSYSQQTFVSGGMFTPTTAQPYPDGYETLDRDTLWLVNFADETTSFTYTAGPLAGKTVKPGHLLFFDVPSNVMDVIPFPDFSINPTTIGALPLDATAVNADKLSGKTKQEVVDEAQTGMINQEAADLRYYGVHKAPPFGTVRPIVKRTYITNGDFAVWDGPSYVSIDEIGINYHVPIAGMWFTRWLNPNFADLVSGTVRQFIYQGEYSDTAVPAKSGLSISTSQPMVTHLVISQRMPDAFYALKGQRVEVTFELSLSDVLFLGYHSGPMVGEIDVRVMLNTENSVMEIPAGQQTDGDWVIVENVLSNKVRGVSRSYRAVFQNIAPDENHPAIFDSYLELNIGVKWFDVETSSRIEFIITNVVVDIESESSVFIPMDESVTRLKTQRYHRQIPTLFCPVIGKASTPHWSFAQMAFDPPMAMTPIVLFKDENWWSGAGWAAEPSVTVTEETIRIEGEASSESGATVNGLSLMAYVVN
ncbi:hypothetical protein A1OO_08565 [Enterovibrio norvegicus FF-33]|uniref:hypothetical protein n=1 Tax=Enterovibrio norvegicus TaxID=188144 RepID=UPI0002E99E2F|nr:hypothetical protein [Enterovibrio norvegicus]OEE65851.1 hypothetical protein A1OO_08565 [Enterovibrio norvegicus FF-33]